MNKHRLNRKEHIKKYNKLRNLHSELLDSMEGYIESGKYDTIEYFNLISKELFKNIEDLGNFSLSFQKEDDRSILFELFVYKNHKKIPSLTEIYLDKKIFRNKDKVKMLESMKNSYVGLFKVVDVDSEEGYVTYQDVFTNKRFKVIDIAMSSTLEIDKRNMTYVYNRIIKFDDISFGTGIHCIMTSQNKELKEFIKKHNYKNCSDFARCIILYKIYKKGNVRMQVNNKYGYRR